MRDRQVDRSIESGFRDAATSTWHSAANLLSEYRGTYDSRCPSTKDWLEEVLFKGLSKLPELQISDKSENHATAETPGKTSGEVDDLDTVYARDSQDSEPSTSLAEQRELNLSKESRGADDKARCEEQAKLDEDDRLKQIDRKKSEERQKLERLKALPELSKADALIETLTALAVGARSGRHNLPAEEKANIPEVARDSELPAAASALSVISTSEEESVRLPALRSLGQIGQTINILDSNYQRDRS